MPRAALSVGMNGPTACQWTVRFGGDCSLTWAWDKHRRFTSLRGLRDRPLVIPFIYRPLVRAKRAPKCGANRFSTIRSLRIGTSRPGQLRVREEIEIAPALLDLATIFGEKRFLCSARVSSAVCGAFLGLRGVPRSNAHFGSSLFPGGVHHYAEGIFGQ
jgi:hypothetical protein